MAVGMASFVVLLVALLGTGGVVAQQACLDQRTCRDCIRTANCQWCEDLDFSEDRCRLSFGESTCANISNPIGDPLQETRPTNLDIIAVSPERVVLNQRVGSNDAQTFQVNVTALRNLPLDLYILMDLSGSLSNVLDNQVKPVASQIIGSLSSITSNVRLGFGSFNDKPTRPFTSQKSIDDLCNIDPPSPVCPYAFRHQISITEDNDVIEARINAVMVTVNVDGPENGLEGLAQVVTCEDIIGWRDRSATGPDRGLNRLVLFITDDAFHYSGEGRLAGILKPYNGRCLLDSSAIVNGSVDYTQWDVYDYPSVGQIAALLDKFNVVPIFAAVNNSNPLINSLGTYQNLADVIRQSHRANAAMLGSGPDVILDVLRQEVEAILQTVSLSPSNEDSLDISFDISATCPEEPTPGEIGLGKLSTFRGLVWEPWNAESEVIMWKINLVDVHYCAMLVDGMACDGVQLEQMVSFEVTVTLNSCYDQNTGELLEFPISFPVVVSGFGEFELSITGNCNCECEAIVEVDSSICNNNGNFTCGACECNDESCGTFCEFDVTSTTLDCPEGIGGFECSGSDRGECDCICQCQMVDTAVFPQAINVTDPLIFSGRLGACECDNFNCEINPTTGEICSGRGECCSGQCVCIERANSNGTSPEQRRYRGDNCECLPSGDICLDSNSTICGGQGECGCEGCECFPGFAGEFCTPDPNFAQCEQMDETCILCAKDRRDRVDSCNGCPEPLRRLYDIDDGQVDAALSSENPNMQFELLANQRIGDGTDYEYLEIMCLFTDIEGCEHEYFIFHNGAQFALLYTTDESCPSSSDFELGIPVWALAPIILGALIILGILLLAIIKIIFLILDYIEVKRLEKEASGADFSKNQNPLYQSPEMKYENVAYGRPL